ncbi:MAG: S1C family serine protease, partial [Candidatus Omnitrophota bacterium]
MKLSKFCRKCLTATAVSIFAAAVCLVFGVPGSAAREMTSLEMLDNCQPSLVSVKSEVGGVLKAPGTGLVRAPDGRMVALNKLVGVKTVSVGGGVIVTASGLIAANAHTVKNAERVTVTLNGRDEVEAEMVGFFPENDIAILKISPPYQLRPVTLVDSGSVRVGQKVFTVGFSTLYRGTLSEGRVTGIGTQSINKDNRVYYVDLIQTSFNVFKGDSGSP